MFKWLEGFNFTARSLNFKVRMGVVSVVSVVVIEGLNGNLGWVKDGC